MPRHAVHVLMISGQPTPNLTPVLDRAFAPDKVILVTSPDMRQRAAWLKAVLRPRGVVLETWQIDNAWDIERIRDQLLDMMVALEGQDLALNATGGTKPMSIAAYELFRQFDLPIFYVHPEQDRIIWLHPSDRPGQALDDRVRLDAFLQAHGARILGRQTNRGIDEPLRLLGEELIHQLPAWQGPLATLNWLASQAERQLQVPIEPDQARRIQPLLEGFTALGLIALEGGRLHFADEAARFYANGGWFEQHVYAQLYHLRGQIPGFQDLGLGLQIQRSTANGEVPNELDIACLVNNRLYLIECKTRSWKGPHASGAGADALYRLDALGDLIGGLQARSMLISYRDIPDHDRQRANDLRIRTCDGKQLRQLRQHLLDWVNPQP